MFDWEDLRSEGTGDTNDDRLAREVVERNVSLLWVVLLELDASVEVGTLFDVALNGGLDLVSEGRHSYGEKC